MRPEGLVAALDLGSAKTCAVIADVIGEGRDIGVKVLGVGNARTTGVKRGVVRDLEETTRSVDRAVRDAQRMAGVEVPALYCGIAGEHVHTRVSPGLASVASEEISRADINRVDDVARAVSLGDDYELLHYLPQEYKVDNQDGISDPVGMTGLRLEVEMCLVSVHTKAATNVRKVVNKAGHRVAELVLEPLAASLAVLTEEEKDLGCVLVDLGGGLTNVAIFHEGKLRHQASLPFAGSHVTADIVHGLGVTQSHAERLKEQWGAAFTTEAGAGDVIELPGTPGQGTRQARRELLVHIIHQRLDETLGLALGQIEASGFGGRLPAGVVLTGGGARLPGIVELAREVFATPVRIGVPDQRVRGLVDSVHAPQFAVPVGLALYGARQRMQVNGGRNSGVHKLVGPVKRWLQDFF